MMRRPDANLSRDIERLSAYLDGDLSPSEVEQLEARLQHEADLRRLFEELRYTVIQLKELPTVRAPRNFTLTPSMAGVKPRRQPLFGFFRFASAVAAVALAVVVGLDVMEASGNLPAMSAVAGDAGQDATMLNEEEMRAAAPEAAEAEMAEPLAMQATEEEQYFGEVDEVEEAPVEAEGLGTGDTNDSGAASDGAEGEVTPTFEFRQDMSAEATATAKSQQTGADEHLDNQVGLEESELQPSAETFWTPIRMVEAGLAAALVVLVLLTLATRRRLL